ncbi:MAG: uracil-DNA glycosylase [Oscillospiraceae bacterium]
MNLEELKSKCLACRACGLAETRTNVVFGTGSPTADVMFVGEAPGRNEDETGIPFVGMAGKLLDCYLGAVGLDRSSVYIANILKCRPPQNRDPNPQEEESCIGFLRSQLEIISPKIVVCLGRIAAQKLISPSFRVTQDHGRFYTIGGRLYMGTYHPAALLRNPENKGAVLRDFVSLSEKLSELSD